MMNFGLTQEHLNMIVEVLSKTPITKAVIFGSRAKGNHKPNSDIDIATFGDNGALLSYELEELPMPYKFDIVSYESIQSEELKEHITRVGKEIYSK